MACTPSGALSSPSASAHSSGGDGAGLELVAGGEIAQQHDDVGLRARWCCSTMARMRSAGMAGPPACTSAMTPMLELEAARPVGRRDAVARDLQPPASARRQSHSSTSPTMPAPERPSVFRNLRREIGSRVPNPLDVSRQVSAIDGRANPCRPVHCTGERMRLLGPDILLREPRRLAAKARKSLGPVASRSTGLTRAGLSAVGRLLDFRRTGRSGAWRRARGPREPQCL